MAETRSNLINPIENLNKTATALLDYFLAVNPVELADCMEDAFKSYSASWSFYKTRHESVRNAIEKMRAISKDARDDIIQLVEDVLSQGKWNNNSYNTYLLRACIKKLYQYDSTAEVSIDNIHALRDRIDILLFMHLEHPHLIEKLTHELETTRKELEEERKRYQEMIDHYNESNTLEKQKKIVKELERVVDEKTQTLTQSMMCVQSGAKPTVLDKLNDQDFLNASRIIAAHKDNDQMNEIELQKKAAAEIEQKRLDYLAKLKAERDQELKLLSATKSLREKKPGDVIALFTHRTKAESANSKLVLPVVIQDQDEQQIAQEAIQRAEAVQAQRIEDLRLSRTNELSTITEMGRSHSAREIRMEQIKRLTLLFANKQKERDIYERGYHVVAGGSPAAALQESYLSVSPKVSTPSKLFTERREKLSELLAGSFLAKKAQPSETVSVEQDALAKPKQSY